MARKFQKIHTFIFDDEKSANRGHGKIGVEYTQKTSFSTLESAIKDSWMWINKEESWIDTTVTKIEIVDKETKEIVWSYKAA